MTAATEVPIQTLLEKKAAGQQLTQDEMKRLSEYTDAKMQESLAKNFQPAEGAETPAEEGMHDVRAMIRAAGVEGQIPSWKTQYGEVEATIIGGKLYVYRGLRRLEFRGLRDSPTGDVSVNEEQTAMMCTLFPGLNEQVLEQEMAGVATTLADLVMALSKFGIEAAPVKL